MDASEPIALVLMTAPDPAVAGQVGRALVEEGLAACATVIPSVTSIYRWEGEVQVEPEAQVLLKTRRALVAELVRRAGELHPYEVPELIALDAEASTAYGRWVQEVTTPPPAA